MSGEETPLILDADGVFLSERPYWNTALATALEASGLSELVGERWETLADLAYGPLGVQRVTKSAGCNSNWDLAAVLVRALEDASWRGVVEELLDAERREVDAVRTLRAAASRLFVPGAGEGDPLLAFGIERDSDFFREVVRRFQAVWTGSVDLRWTFERTRPVECAQRMQRALGELRDAGWSVRVCTSRHRDEIEAPIRQLGLDALLPSGAITSADEVDRAESASGRRPLGKPHWFGPLSATVGFAPALEVLSGTRSARGRGVYVGDAWADFRAVQGCRTRGLDLAFVHSRSGVTTTEQEKRIARDPRTLGFVSRPSELVPLLAGVPS